MCGVSTPWESQSMVPTSPGRQTTLTVNTLGPGTYLSNLNPNIFFLGVSKQNMFVFLFVLLLRVSKPSYNLSYTSIWDHWNVSTTTLNDKYTPLNKDHVRLQRTPLNPTKKKKKKMPFGFHQWRVEEESQYRWLIISRHLFVAPLTCAGVCTSHVQRIDRDKSL